MGFMGLIGLGGGATSLSFGGGAASVTGGTLATPGNGYTYHVFSYPHPSDAAAQLIVAGANLVAPQVSLLIVAGGGSGGFGGGGSSAAGGGGGGGGVKYEVSLALPAGSYPITVGAGGAATPSEQRNAGEMSPYAGGYSQFGPQPAYGRSVGGGYGGTKGTWNGGNGGCGGGAGDWQPGGEGDCTQTDPSAATPSPSQNPTASPLYGYFGSDGGNGRGSDYRGGGGGGGASEAGQAAGSPGEGGDGGAGYPCPNFPSPLIYNGLQNPQQSGQFPQVGVLFGGGGGGGSNGNAGPGGGGAGNSNAIQATGGGGGGGNLNEAGHAGANGLVVVRRPADL